MEEARAGSYCTQNKPKHITTASRSLHDLACTHLSNFISCQPHSLSFTGLQAHQPPSLPWTSQTVCHLRISLYAVLSAWNTTPLSTTPPSCFNLSGLNLQVTSSGGNACLTSQSRVYFLCSTYTSVHLFFFHLSNTLLFSFFLFTYRTFPHTEFLAAIKSFNIGQVPFYPLKSCWHQNMTVGGIHETSAQAWCTGKTQRNGVEREVGRGIGMGNTCKIHGWFMSMYGKNHYNIVK